MPRTRGSKRRRATTKKGSASVAASSSANIATERLSDPSHAETVLKGLERLWRNGVLCDLTLRCCSDSEEPAMYTGEAPTSLYFLTFVESEVGARIKIGEELASLRAGAHCSSLASFRTLVAADHALDFGRVCALLY